MEVKCYCDLIAEVKTSHTQNNFNRDFYKCPREKCKFWSWADKFEPRGTPSPATSQVPASSTTAMKRGASVMDDFPEASPSQKRIRLMEAVLGTGGSSDHPGASSILSPDVSNVTVGGTPSNTDAPQASAKYNNVGVRLPANNAAHPQTPTKLAIHSPSPCPGPFDFSLGSQQSSASNAQDDGHPLGSGEMAPESIENIFNVLGSIPDYIRKLDRKRIAAEKSLDARNKKIEYLEDEVKRLKDRQKELELIIADYEAKGL